MKHIFEVYLKKYKKIRDIRYIKLALYNLQQKEIYGEKSTKSTGNIHESKSFEVDLHYLNEIAQNHDKQITA